MGQDIDKVKESLEAFLDNLKDAGQVRKSLINDPGLMKAITENVISELIRKGLMEDKLLTPVETMSLLDIKHRETLKKYRDKGLTPVYPHENSRPRYRLSDVNQFLRRLT